MARADILYIEDNPENRLLVRRTLEASGYALTEAVDGPSGLKAAQESRPDLILLDISLPEMDGYDLARRFAGFEHLEHVPVLAVTANVMKGDKEHALEAGCDGYIPKPIDIDQLPLQVDEALQRAHRGNGEPETEVSGGVPGSEALGLVDEAARDPGSAREEPVQAVRDESTAGARSPAAMERRTDVRSPRDAMGGAESEDAAPVRSREAEPTFVSRPSLASIDQNRGRESVDEAGRGSTEDPAQPVQLENHVPVDQMDRFEQWGGLGQTDEGAAAVALPEACQASVVQELESLAADLGARAIVLAQGSQVVAQVGGPDGWRPEELAALAVQGFRVSDSVASLLGCDGGCREQITDSGTVLLHAVSIDGDLVLMAAMPASVPLGAARLWVRKTAGRVDRIVRREI